MKTPGQRIAETVYHLEEGETYASVEGKRAALARRIDAAIAKHKVRTPPEGKPEKANKKVGVKK